MGRTFRFGVMAPEHYSQPFYMQALQQGIRGLLALASQVFFFARCFYLGKRPTLILFRSFHR